eukprot:1454094-Rhodomonas_salina.2
MESAVEETVENVKAKLRETLSELEGKRFADAEERDSDMQTLLKEVRCQHICDAKRGTDEAYGAAGT